MNTHHIITALYLIAAVNMASASAAAVDWQKNRLIPLDKITVGPWDNYEATVTNEGNALYFTRAINQIPNIFIQNLGLNEPELLIGKNGDAKDPAIDATGQKLAVTFFGQDAQGDVCLFKLSDRSMNCITDENTADESPFWIDANHIGFLSRPTAQLDWQLVSHDLASGEKRILHQGFISAPVASPDSRYILFNQADMSDETRVRVFDREANKLIDPARFDLPGITGFMAFSKDGRFLYFSHYLSDTNLDQVIDGSDHSVMFRIPFTEWLTTNKPLMPEQLTPVSNNCKYPSTTPTHLYLTCAFEGTLDVYRIPLSGTVPPEWDKKQLWEAHRAARSHEARLLILNTLRYRFGENGAAMLERLLSNHLEIGEFSAATYYVQQLAAFYRQRGESDLAGFYQALEQLLKVKSAKQSVPVGLVTARFQRVVADTRTQIHSQGNGQRLIYLIDGYLDYEIENRDAALARLAHIDLTEPTAPMERYLAFELYRLLLQEAAPQRLLQYYPLMFNEATLSFEAKLYYAFNYLSLLAQTQNRSAERIQTISAQIKAASTPGIAELFRAEIASMELAEEKTKKNQGQRFKALTDILKKNKDDLLLRKAMHTRAIQILGEAEQFQLMEALSRHWLITTHVSEMEFYNVAEQYAMITMDKAYAMMAEGELARAYSTFYSAIRQTNDLEAHYQFLTLGLNPALNKRENLDQSYQILARDELLGQNGQYVQALRLLLESETPTSKNLDKALSLLAAMEPSGLSPSMRDLLMGYIYHQKLRLTRTGYGYNKDFFKKAHYHYMMAFDLARDNGRILASVWQNLGTLHFEAHNYSLATAFFAQRMKLPFAGDEQQALARLAYARSLFYSNDRDGARQQAESALALVRANPALDVTPFLEKAAFYSMQAGAYDAADRYFDVLLRKHNLSPPNRAKALLGHGYTFYKLGKQDQARERLNAALDTSAKLDVQPTSGTRLLAFQPQRLELIAQGLLARLAKDPEQQVNAHLARIRILTQMAGRTDEFAYEEASRLSLLAKDYQYAAVAYERRGDVGKVADMMDQALYASINWAKETDDDLGPVVYRTLVNYLSLGLSHPEAYKARKTDVLTKACNRALKSYAALPARAPVTVAQRVTLTMLWEAYRVKVIGEENHDLAQRLDAALYTDEANALKTDRPDAYQQLVAMHDRLKR